jgi:predicted enzyme related to lactoylglutathione lyase
VQKLNGKEAGGLMQNPQNGAPDCWLAYFLTPDLKDSTRKAKSLGATIMMEAAPIPGIGAFSLLADPVGAVICLFEPAMQK